MKKIIFIVLALCAFAKSASAQEEITSMCADCSTNLYTLIEVTDSYIKDIKPLKYDTIGQVLVRKNTETSTDFSFSSPFGWTRIEISADQSYCVYLKGTKIKPFNNLNNEKMVDIWIDIDSKKITEKDPFDWIKCLKEAQNK